MQIKHNIKREWNKLSWKILECIFDEREEKWNCYLMKEWRIICSYNWPSLWDTVLYICWEDYDDEDRNDKIVEYEYPTEEEAIKMLNFINSITIQDEEEIEAKCER